MSRPTWASALTVFACAASHAAAQAPAAANGEATPVTILERKAKNSIFNFDYGPPTSPAMNLLGLTADKTPPSTSLTKFVISVPQLFSGEAGQAIAFDASIGALSEPQHRSSFVRYAGKSWFYRMSYRTRIGAAGMNGDAAGGDASKAIRSRVALGFSASLLDSSDPLVTGPRDNPLLIGCLNGLNEKVRTALAPTANFDPADEALSLRRNAYERAAAALRKEPPDYTEARGRLGPYLPGAALAAPPAPPPAPAAPTPEQQRAAIQKKIDELARDASASPAKTAEILSQILALNAPPPRPAEPPRVPATPPTPATGVLSNDALKAKVEKEAALIASSKGIAAEQARADEAKNALDDKALAAVNLEKHIANCALAASRQARFSPDLDVGAGVLWRGEPGKLDDLHDGGQVIWAAYKHPIGVRFPQPDENGVYADGVDAEVPKSAFMLAGSVRYADGEYLATGDTALPEMRADTLDAWVGLEWLSDDLRVAARYGWLDVDARSPAAKAFEKSGERYLLSSQVRLGDSGLWLGASYGNGYGTTDTLKATTALITLSFTPPPPPAIASAR